VVTQLIFIYLNFFQHILLALYWMMFAIVHTGFASETIKEFAESLMKRNFKFYRLCFSIVAALMLTYILYYNFTIPTILLWHSLLVEKILSILSGMIGLFVMLLCIRKYFFYLSGIDVFYSRQSEGQLQVNGLNRYVRHPLYAGTLLFAWSFFFWEPLLSNLISCVCISVYTFIGIYFEEKKLIKSFGEEYKTYAGRVPMIIPKIR
jgi:protein-S-isoprenylcysteine O-methyltransferase Ste14